MTSVDLSTLEAILFDLDGVLTDTAAIHQRAWATMFDEFLQRWGPRHGHPFEAFTPDDYLRFVDGKPRLAGVSSFLESRRIVLPDGTPTDPPDMDTIHGLATRKNDLVLERIAAGDAVAFEGSLRFVAHVRALGIRTAVVSSSRNAGLVLESVGIAELFEDRVDGVTAAELGLPGKPAPDTFIACAQRLGVEPAAAAVVEDAIVGVQAGRLGGFALVIGVDRDGDPDRLLAEGADVVVEDLGDLVDAG